MKTGHDTPPTVTEGVTRLVQTPEISRLSQVRSVPSICIPTPDGPTDGEMLVMTGAFCRASATPGANSQAAATTRRAIRLFEIKFQPPGDWGRMEITAQLKCRQRSRISLRKSR